MPDNLAFQPVTGNLYIVEDQPNGNIIACLPDGTDKNQQTDGCVKVLSLKDSSAEPTGLVFSADGKTAYLSIQHSNDQLLPAHDGIKLMTLLKLLAFYLIDFFVISLSYG